MPCNDCLSREEVINLINTTTGTTGTSSNLPIGMVSFVVNSEAVYFDSSGLGSGKWLGWAIANGNNGTVNWAGKYVVARDPGDANFNTADTTGGSKQFTLTIAQLAAHTHLENANLHNHPITDPGHNHAAISSTELGNVTLASSPSSLVNVNDGTISTNMKWQTIVYENAPSSLNDPQNLSVVVTGFNTNITPLTTGTLINIGTHGQSTVTIPAHNHGTTNLSHSHTITNVAATSNTTTGSTTVGGLAGGSAGSGDPVTHLPPYVVGIPIQKIT